MHNFMGLKVKQKFILGFVFTILIFVGLYIFNKKEWDQSTLPVSIDGETEYIIDERPTDFVKVGVITANNPGLGQDTLYLIYEEPGKPALKREIIIDTLSVCDSLPCLAMSRSFDLAFGGKRAVVEGIKEGEDSVILRKMTIVAEGQEPRINEVGSIFVPWSYVRSLIKECKVSSVMQTHSLDVYVTIKENNSQIRTVEPVIDEVFRVVDEVRDKCQQIIVGTE